MKAEIKVNVKLAAEAGLNEYGRKVVEFDPADLNIAQQKVLSGLDVDENKFFLLNPYEDIKVGDASINSLKTILNKKIESLKKIEDRKIKEIKEWMKLSLDDRVDKYLDEQRLESAINTVSGAREAVEERNAAKMWLALDYKIECKLRDKKEKKEQAEKKAKKEAETISKKELKKAYISKWVGEKGTQSQKDRLAADMLPNSEIITEIRTETFSVFDNYKKYRKITENSFCRCREDDYGEADNDVDFYASEKEKATEEEFEQLQEMKRLLSGFAVFTLKEHTGECSSCDYSKTKTSILVSIEIAGIPLSREYDMN